MLAGRAGAGGEAGPAEGTGGDVDPRGAPCSWQAPGASLPLPWDLKPSGNNPKALLTLVLIGMCFLIVKFS